AGGARVMRVLVVDDEAPARAELRHLLGAHADVEVVGEAVNAAQAVELAPRSDVIFLDVEMPGASGLDAAPFVPHGAHGPLVALAPVPADYAGAAFAGGAFAYLLKQMAPARLPRAIERLRARRPRRGSPTRIPVVAAAGTELIDEQQVHYVQAEGDYSRVHTF